MNNLMPAHKHVAHCYSPLQGQRIGNKPDAVSKVVNLSPWGKTTSEEDLCQVKDSRVFHKCLRLYQQNPA